MTTGKKKEATRGLNKRKTKAIEAVEVDEVAVAVEVEDEVTMVVSTEVVKMKKEESWD